MRFYLLIMPFLILSHTSALSQISFGIGSGPSGIENHSPDNTSLDMNLSIALNEKWTGMVSYTKWSGRDGNYTTFKNEGLLADIAASGYEFYGNHGIQLFIYNRIFARSGYNLYVGGGLGAYQMYRVDELLNDHSSYQSTFGFSFLVKKSIGQDLSFFSRAHINFELFDEQPRWGGFGLGLMYSIF